MRQFFAIALAAGLCLPLAAEASYLRLEAGLVTKGSHDGYAVAATAGTPVFGKLNLEAELSYSDVSDTFFGVELGQREFAAIANLTTNISLGGGIDLVLGAGAGVASVSNDFLMGFTTFSESETGLALQGIAGIDLALSDDVDLSLRYRYRDVAVDNYGESNSLITVGVSFAF
jgi:opacity protein-like surface antigen